MIELIVSFALVVFILAVSEAYLFCFPPKSITDGEE